MDAMMHLLLFRIPLRSRASRPVTAGVRRLVWASLVVLWFGMAACADESSQTGTRAEAVLTVTVKDAKPLGFTAGDLGKLERAKIEATVEGKHLVFEGVKLSTILHKAGMTWGTKCSLYLDCYVVVDSRDEYRAVFAVPEVDPGLAHQFVILADRCNGEPIRKSDGPYEIIEQDAKERGRWVKQVKSISVKEAAEDEESSGSGGDAKPKGKVYLVGMGPGGAELVTIKAAAILKQADCVFCFDYLKGEVARYAPEERIRVAPSGLMGGFGRQKIEELPEDLRERAKKSIVEIEKFSAEVRALVAEGKSVACADAGDPTMYCPWSWITSEFADLHPRVVPGLSSFNAGNAALGQSITSHNGSITISAGEDLGEKTAAGRLRGTLVLFTHRAKFAELLPRLRDRYPGDTPAAVVCEASYPSERVYRGTLADIESVVGDEKLPHLYLIYVGDALQSDAAFRQSGPREKPAVAQGPGAAVNAGKELP